MSLIITTTWNCRRIVEAFLDHHRALGFDRVMVMDYDSTDGTRDVLGSARYAGFVDLVPFPGIADLDSSNLMLRLAQARFDPSTPCLFCDPDEFLVLRPARGVGDLGVADLGVADLDLTGASALVLPRFNVTSRLSQALGDPDGVHPLGCLTIRIDARVVRSHVEMVSGVLDSPWIYTTIGPKVLVRLGDAVSIGAGDHSAAVRGPPPRSSAAGAYLLHFPFSTFADLRRKVEMNRLDFEANPGLPPIYGWHARRWIRLTDETRLWTEYKAHFIDDDDLPNLIARGVVTIDTSVRDASRNRGDVDAHRGSSVNLVTRQAGFPTPDTSSVPRTIYVVLGMHRSGTSLCSSIMHALGVDMANDRWVDRGNEHGHWERTDIVEVQDTILNITGRPFYSPTHDFPMPSGWWRWPEIRPYITQLKAIVTEALRQTDTFGFKDPRTVKLIPIWTALFAQLKLRPKYVICLRNPAHVAASLQRRDGLDPLVGEFRWLDYTADCFRYTAGQDVHVVNYEDWFSDPLATLDALGDFLNLDVANPFEDARAVAEALIRPEANHAGDKGQKPKIPLVRHVYDMTRQVAGGESDGAQLRSFIEHFTAFRQLLTPFEKKLEQAIADERVQNSTTLAAALEAKKLATLDVVTARDAATDGQRYLAASDAESHQRSALMAAEIAALRDLVAKRDQALAEAHARVREQAGMRARAEDRLAAARGIHARSIVKLHAISLHAISDASTEDGEHLVRDLLDELFPEDWYLDRNPDVRAADFPALAHYVGYGIAEGRHPHPLWSDDAQRDD